MTATVLLQLLMVLLQSRKIFIVSGSGQFAVDRVLAWAPLDAIICALHACGKRVRESSFSMPFISEDSSSFVLTPSVLSPSPPPPNNCFCFAVLVGDVL